MEPDTRPDSERAYPCCRHCTHKNATPPWPHEGHPLSCMQCEQYENWAGFLGRELADMLEAIR